MGFLGEIKKLLFGVSSVSKSGARKVADKSREIGDDLKEKGGAYYEKGKDVAGDAFDKGKDMAGNAYEKGKDLAEDAVDKIGDTLSDLKAKAKNMLDDVSDSPTVEKAGDFTSNVGKKVIDNSKIARDKAADLSETVGEKVLDAKDKIVEKAGEIGETVKRKFDETYEKAKALEAEEALQPKGEFADTPLDVGDSLLEETDDFFSKAEKYAEGNYDGKDKAPVSADDREHIQVGDTTISLPEPDANPKTMAKAAGFEDLDGDGNELVDDAIILDDIVEEQIDSPIVDALPSGADITDQVVSSLDTVVESAENASSTAKDMASSAVDQLSKDAQSKIDEMKDIVENMADDDLTDESKSDDSQS